MCHTSDICVLCMVTSVTWSWPWTELNIKHLLNQCLALYFRSTRGKFWPKTDNFEVSTARNLKAPILTFDLTLTWHVTSFGKFRGCFRIVSSRAFKRRIVRLSAAIRSRVMTWGRLTPLPSKSRVAKYPSKCRVKGEISVCAAQPDPTQPDQTRPHHAFEKLISLERVDRFTSGLLCSMSPFNKFRIWPTPIPAGACHGTWHVPSRGCRRHPLHR